ncbi:ABC transporter ATP-binding protein [Rhizobium alvei]|uniref:Spermidine/putrescine import ATP-binding protein PotA n=1 Tax=Rhizobium alvei TaxID=1132659 RepID=A0ABT8YNS8_9HYPH|nr:ABC transporter ATP-binding protein [Rhizobium alvei]MDO6965344.1 ABC transporter ATP-binding protein [Rhizobium alvei]
MTGLNAIEIRGITKTYGYGEFAVTAVDEANLAIRQNEFFTLLGPSGCGKTTLLRLIAGFEFPAAGDLLLHGENIAIMPPFKRPVNTVFQNYALFPHMTVADNIGFGLKMLGRPASEVEARVAEMLKLVRMEKFAKRATSQLSGGQQQRVALARALAPHPKVLLLDEPLSALDYKLRKEMQIELKRLQAETGITFVFVTHDQEEALTMSDRIAVMSAGKILQVGGPREIYDRPANRFVADFIGETNFLKGKVSGLGSDTASVALDCAANLAVPASADLIVGEEVTVLLRPEHARLVPVGSAEAALTGTLKDIIYFGTDTYFNVSLSDGTLFTVRQQNRPDEVGSYSVGDQTSVAFAPAAIRILRG